MRILVAAVMAAFFMSGPVLAETMDVPAVLQIDPDTIRGPKGDKGEPGPVGPQGEPGIAPEEVQDIINRLEDLEGRVTVLEGAKPPEEEPPAPPAETVLPGALDTYWFVTDAFRSTDNRAYAMGAYDGAEVQLEMGLGGVDGEDVAGVSGGFRSNFTLAEAGNVSLTVVWRQEHPWPFEPGECATALVAIDGKEVAAGPQLCGRDGQDDQQHLDEPPPLTATISLEAGEHTLTVGGHLSVKTEASEIASFRFDFIGMALGDVAPVPPAPSEPPAEPEPPAEEPPQTGDLPEGVITPLDFGAVCDGVNDDSAAVDAWLDELERRNASGVDETGGIPFDANCQAQNVRPRNFTADPNVVQLGTLDLGGREIIWGIDSPTFTWIGTGKMVCDKPGGIGRTIAFLMAPRADYDGGGPTLDFNPSRTTDNEQITLDLAEWDGCQPLVLQNHHPVPSAFDPVVSQHRIKRLYFDGWVHDVQGGVILSTARFGDSQAMTIADGQIVSGAPAIEIHGRFTNIDGRPCGKAGYCGRAIMIGSRRETADSNGSVLITAEVDGVYQNGDEQFWDGNETQALAIRHGHNWLIRDTRFANVRHAGIHNDMDDGEAPANTHGNRSNNAECLYGQGVSELWAVNLTLENCDGSGLDAQAWTVKGGGPTYARNLTVKWTHPTWKRWDCRLVRLGEGGGDFRGVTIEGFPECRAWATEGDPNTHIFHIFRSFGGGQPAERVFDLTLNGEFIQ